MKTRCLATMFAIAGASLCAGQSGMAPKATVTVCMEFNQQVLADVRPLTSAMFASVGVRIDWRERNSCPVGASAIDVSLSHDLSNVRGASFSALAFARPYDRTIVIFLDRVQKLNRSGVRSLLAQVLVHEITHVLQGVNRHSATGIMKAHWNDSDYFEMRRRPLPFAPEDVNLIYDGLEIPRVATAAMVAQGAVAGQ